MDDKTLKQLTRTLLLHAKGLGLPIGAAEVFIEKSLLTAKKTLSSHSVITENDVTRAVAKELRKYNSDLAYVYQNRDKII